MPFSITKGVVAGLGAVSSLLKDRASTRPEIPKVDFSKLQMGIMAPKKKSDSVAAPVAGTQNGGSVESYLEMIKRIREARTNEV
jgi:hypothetical protein